MATSNSNPIYTTLTDVTLGEWWVRRVRRIFASQRVLG
jgi:hypothetical protein